MTPPAENDAEVFDRSRSAGRRMAQELVRWALEAQASETPLDPRVVVQAADEYLADALASGESPRGGS
jgi:hypothetical protein